MIRRMVATRLIAYWLRRHGYKRCLPFEETDNTQEKGYIKMPQTFRAYAPDISCGGCANAINRSLIALPGVQMVEVDIPGKNITVKYDDLQLTDDDLRTRLEKAGYPVR